MHLNGFGEQQRYLIHHRIAMRDEVFDDLLLTKTRLPCAFT